MRRRHDGRGLVTGVVLAVSHAAEDAIAAAIAAHPSLSLVRRCADLAEALAAASAGVAGVAVVSPQPHLDRVTIGELAHMGVRVVGVAVDDADRHALVALGIAVVDASQPDAVAQAAATAPAPAQVPQAPEPAPASGMVVAVWGPTGAPGRTSVAVNVAAELARERSVLVADLDVNGAAVAQALGIANETPGVAALARSAAQGNADADAVRRFSVRVGERLAVLTGLPRASRWAEVAPAALDAAWPALRAAADVTVVDLAFGIAPGERRDGAAVAALAEADVVVAVGSGDPVGMQRLVDGLADLDDVVPGARERALVVVNRVRASVAGPKPERQVADALARYAGVSRTWIIPWDPRTADAAALRGATWLEVAPRSPSSRAIVVLANAVRDALARKVRDTPAPSRAVEAALTD